MRAKRFAPPLTMSEAIAWLEKFLSTPGVAVLSPSESSLQQTLQWIGKHNLGRKRVLDTHLAAILHASGVTRLLTSNPGDFALFPSLEIVTP